jgi:hypothetical protein
MNDGNILGFGFGSSPIVTPIPVNDKNFVFNQTTPSDIWIVPHGLGKRVSVEVTNDLSIGIGCVIEWNSDNEVTIYFNQPRTGWVYCN